MAYLHVENISFRYPGSKENTIEEISFDVHRGDFIVLCGETGSGKSTLLRLLKKEIAPVGQLKGRIVLEGQDLQDISARETASKIGYVMQRPEQQIVTDKVWHELAFGLENLEIPQAEIARRTAEMAAYFGIEGWYEKPVKVLSGGQKQLLNLAAVMIMQPEILILDEPTAQLDPISASEFIATVRKLNRELGLTVIMIEHRLEEVISCCDRMLIMKNGHLVYQGTPQTVTEELIRSDAAMLEGMPASVRLYGALEKEGKIPLGVREGRLYVRNGYKNQIRSLKTETYEPAGTVALEMAGVCFRYDRHSPDVLQGLELKAYTGEILCVLGGNGSGKTTMLSVAAGIHRAYAGRIGILGKPIKQYKNQSLYRECLTLLPQDVQTVFLHASVREELAGAQTGVNLLPVDISHLYDRHPYDLSGGEQQLVALAKVLSTNPRLLLLDEPTKGLDAAAKKSFARVLCELKAKGMAIVVVTHDVEFAAICADRCALFFRGEIVSVDETGKFFANSSFYTTAVSRMTQGYYDGAVLVEDAVKLCRLNGRKECNE